MLKRHYNFKEVGGLPISATASWKSASTDQTYGLALAFHGGGFVIGSRHFIPEAEIEHLCDAHFIVVSADYRLCPQVALCEVIQDAMDAYLWCKSDLPALLKADMGINVDARKIVAFGQSAGGLLALKLGSLPDPPRAILDFYGIKYLSDEFWSTPLPALAGIPSLEESFLDQVFNEPTLTTTVSSLEEMGASLAVEKARGMPPPDLSQPRNAWLFTALRDGTQLRAIVRDDNFNRDDPAQAFKPGFPATIFLHGDADAMVPTRFSEQASEDLKRVRVETELVLVPGQPHGFDAGISKNDEDWPYVQRALDFLIAKARG